MSPRQPREIDEAQALRDAATMSAAALARKHNIGYGRALSLQRRAGAMQDAQEQGAEVQGSSDRETEGIATPPGIYRPSEAPTGNREQGTVAPESLDLGLSQINDPNPILTHVRRKQAAAILGTNAKRGGDLQLDQGRQVSSFNPDGDSEPPETKNLEPDTSSDHYACVIADLVAKRDLLQHAIETLEALRP